MPTTLLQVNYVPTFCVEAVFGVDRDDGKRRLHIVAIAPNQDIDALMASVNGNFADDGDPVINQDDINKIKEFAAPFRTIGITTSYEQKQQEILNAAHP